MKILTSGSGCRHMISYRMQHTMRIRSYYINSPEEFDSRTTKRFRLSALCILLGSVVFAQPSPSPQTFCNPLNLSYRFMNDAIDAREAADPLVILFHFGCLERKTRNE